MAEVRGVSKKLGFGFCPPKFLNRDGMKWLSDHFPPMACQSFAKNQI